MRDYEPVMSAEEVDGYVREIFPQSTSFGWRAISVDPGLIKVGVGTSQKDLRPGGTISGPTMFGVADLTAYLLILAHIGRVPLAVTTNLNINFLNKPDPGELVSLGRLLKLGKRLAVCDVELQSSASSQIVAHATATYSIPPR